MVFLARFLLQNVRSKPNLRKVRKSNYKVVAITLIGVLGALCPIYIFPLYQIQSYKNIQKEARAGIDQEEIQPGGMRVWSDPFLPKPEAKKD